MSSAWLRLGFKESPYRTTPLYITEDDAELFVGREAESATFLTLMDTTDGCVVIVSGHVGIGKTSFLNVHQYWMATGKAGDAPRLIPSLENAVLLGGGSVRSMARSCVHQTVKNVDSECKRCGRGLPNQTSKIKKWLSHAADSGGFGISLQILGSGGSVSRSVNIPAVSEATIENWQEILSVVASECVYELGVDGVVVCFDNVESLNCAEVAQIMMAFRDTLFMTKNVWWVVIGQSQLYAQLESYDQRISQRVRGPGVEIPPMTGKELHELIERRIRRYRADETALSPLSESIHERLSTASRGVARFMLDTADMLMTELITDVRMAVTKHVDHSRASPEVMDTAFNKTLSRILFGQRFPDSIAERKLADRAASMLGNGRLTLEEVDLLEKIGDHDVTPEDFATFGAESCEQFEQTQLINLADRALLERRFLGGKTHYRLAGFSYLCLDLGAFDQVRDVIKGGE